MNSIFENAALEVSVPAGRDAIETLIFVDDSNYEFVGGGMAANGL